MMRNGFVLAVADVVNTSLHAAQIIASAVMALVIWSLSNRQRKIEKQESQIDELVERSVDQRFEHHATTMTKTAEALSATAKGAADTLSAMVRMIEKRQDTIDVDIRALMKSVDHMDQRNQDRSEKLTQFIIEHCATKQDIQALNGRFDRELLKQPGKQN